MYYIVHIRTVYILLCTCTCQCYYSIMHAHMFVVRGAHDCCVLCFNATDIAACRFSHVPTRCAMYGCRLASRPGQSCDRRTRPRRWRANRPVSSSLQQCHPPTAQRNPFLQTTARPWRPKWLWPQTTPNRKPWVWSSCVTSGLRMFSMYQHMY